MFKTLQREIQRKLAKKRKDYGELDEPIVALIDDYVYITDNAFQLFVIPKEHYILDFTFDSTMNELKMKSIANQVFRNTSVSFYENGLVTFGKHSLNLARFCGNGVTMYFNVPRLKRFSNNFSELVLKGNGEKLSPVAVYKRGTFVGIITPVNYTESDII